MFVFRIEGRPSWHYLIPVYGDYVYSDILFGDNRYFFGVLATLAVYIFGYFSNNIILLLVSVLLDLGLSIIAAVALADMYGKGKGFAVGLVLLPIIFYPWLAAELYGLR